MKILIDTNIVLDLILEREPFVESAIALFEQIERGNLEGYIAATTITNIFYIILDTPRLKSTGILGSQTYLKTTYPFGNI
ncbi:MAG: PIN domain-containing protein [Microcoleus sp. PH2017_15_JOR_U_A]|uniref:type II toxin-antitoxin system VapC family toxin n=1 Tax=unclassified Microcoleus TaxID=2642155 RepID=UPI001D7F5028|nr:MULTISPECIES: PIN domain-containing protein [unclassified Microcoleus]MCC3471298.1 PIN domain-containing protein [Microcoleus sp. PH2017_13_LAR_U_A]MCC3483976.1 PIN domain-containing protein [Microcoleus sp. PH2017_14_LAR_D_A]MCC3496024.1 PIN domain-containing protein [Microcoleus sp. PH2017_15_JOR_U_A]MCC3596770.1 PIN domain-containing protein [Microcoleus sp. PH2017_26_ELK_O_A]MCC3621750.1 PIN domain-containing protein [Microcoleus sp. PH2017_36_ELK_O_B]